MQKMEFTYEYAADSYIINLEGNLDLYASPALKTAFKNLEGKEAKKVALIMSKVNYLDSSALGALVFGAALIEKTGGRLYCVDTHDDIKSLFRSVELGSHVSFCDNLEALATT